MDLTLGILTVLLSWHAVRMLKTIKPETDFPNYVPATFGLIVWISASAGGGWVLIAIFLFAGSAVLWWDTWSGIRRNSETKQTNQLEPHIPVPDTPDAIDARSRSLAAMKRATSAREQDIKKRAEQPAQNIYTSRYLADIEFDYRDAGGHDSHRHVGVEAVDDEYFEGHCHTAQDTRTFVIGRVRGKVLDRDTGELQPPKRWADGVRADPRNSGVVVSRGWKSPDVSEDEERKQPIEILFTGFSKEQRAELEEQAEIFEMVVRKNVTKGLKYLCAGPNAGPAKLSQAIEAGVQIIDESEFVQLLVRS